MVVSGEFLVLPVLGVLLPLLGVLEDPFEYELVLPGVLYLPEGAEEVEPGVVADGSVAGVDLLFHEHGGLDVVYFGVGALAATLHELSDGLEGSRVLQNAHVV